MCTYSTYLDHDNEFIENCLNYYKKDNGVKTYCSKCKNGYILKMS